MTIKYIENVRTLDVKWYAGHYHTEKKIDNLQIIFENIEELYGQELSI